VVYDPQRRYREITESLSSDRCRVILAGESLLTAREEANASLGDLALGKIHELVIWVPFAPSVEEERQKDPFSVFASVGAFFPNGDGDEYPEICRRAMPEHVTEINRLFDEGTPTFEMIDSLAKGVSWPKLKTLLGVSSPREILLALLAPKESQVEELKRDTTWFSEAREFIQKSLGYTLKTKGQTQKSIGDELWRVLLVSEFIFDSGGSIPEGMATVPRAANEAKALVYDVCDSLRRHDDYKEIYMTTAQEIEDELDLRTKSRLITDLGIRDTFACEERIYLDRLVDKVSEGDLDTAQTIWRSRERSIWLSRQDRMAEWTLAARALDLLLAASQFSSQKFASLEAIILSYASAGRDLDRHHREMEQAANQIQEDHDGVERLLQIARQAYFRTVEQLQGEFTRLVQAEGWPATGGGKLLWNRQIFNKVVAPELESGSKVAYFLVDSLRYELGVEIEKQLSDKLKVSMHPVCAQLPTYTEIGMASLMPDAESELSLEPKGEKLVTTLGGTPATTPAARFAFLQSKKGDLCADIELSELIAKKKVKLPEQTRLLVVRTRDIDTLAHGSPRQVLDLIPNLIREIVRGISEVTKLGFDTAVIATDHGFLLFHDQEAGDLAPKPPGNWQIEKSRCLLGKGEADAQNLVFDAKVVGIPGEVRNYAVPKMLVPYARGQVYCHEGLSLQECVLPCLTIKLEPAKATKQKAQAPEISITYKQGKTNLVSMRRPVIDLSWPAGELFADESEREVVVEAVSTSGETVGVAGTGQAVNPATGCVRIRPGSAISVGLRMDENFTGNFKVRVLDAVTNMTITEISLKTQYPDE